MTLGSLVNSHANKFRQSTRPLVTAILFAMISLTCCPDSFCQGTQEDAKQESAAKPQRKKSKKKSPTAYWPKDVEWNDDIPSPTEFFGFDVGFRHLRHDQVAAYMKELARVSDRITIQQYAETHGGRPLLLLTITSPENHANISDIRSRHRQLSKPGKQSVDISELPAVMNMGYGVHGDEPSATNTSPLVAHYLAAAEGPQVEKILKNSVILLDPSLNPDGFDRFARWANTFRGQVTNPDPSHWEHNQSWPPGRVNYYWFDLNRDWLPLQHPESQGRMKWYHSWKPNVVLDFHEMGTDATYFFQPGIPERTNPLTPQANIDLTRELAGYHAKDLDQIGSLYFTQEVFDDFYMGKGSTYPDLHGSVGVLFEQASSRGHVQDSANGLLKFSDTIENQFTASLSSLRGVAEMRAKLLQYQADFYRQSLDDAKKSPIKAYAFSLPNNHTRVQNFANILIRHDIQCFWLKKDVIVNDRVIKAGSLIVPAEQPEYRFLRSLVERRTKFRESVFYDVSAWTLPLAFNLRQSGLKSTIDKDELQRCKLNEKRPTAFVGDDNGDDTVAYLMDWRDDEAVVALQKLMAADVHVRVATRLTNLKTGSQNDAVEEFSYGSIAIPLGVDQNKPKRRTIDRIVKQSMKRGVRFHKVTSGLAMGGIDLGSSNFPRVKNPSVAMLVGKPVSAYQAGAVWHQLDFRIGMPVSLVPSTRVEQTDWTRYTTLIVVGGSYQLSPAANERIQRFVRDGGTLIGISSGTKFAEQDILQLASGEAGEAESASKTDEEKAKDEAEKDEAEKKMPRFDEARKLAALEMVNGSIFKAEIDSSHPLMFGVAGKHLSFFRTSTSLLKQATPQVSNPAVYTQAPLMAGYASEKNVQEIAGSSAVTVHSMGRGRVILLADDPNFRAFWPATSRVFMNAIYFGPFAESR